MKLYISALFVTLSVSAAFSQVNTARMDGTVTDSGGALVPAASVEVVNPSQQQSFKAVADEKGYWAIPSLPSGTYKVTVSHPGFKTELVANVKMDAGVPATVNVTLEVGALTETIQVTAGAEIVQADTATITSTLQGTQIHDLPFTSHNVTELIATQPGTQAGERRSLLHHQRPAAKHHQHHDRWHQRAGQRHQEQSGRDLQRRAAAHRSHRGNDHDLGRRRR